jgi:tripartite-type tricarboxylate transporter receptor subunit TctC
MRRTYATGFLRRPGVAFALMLSISTAAAQGYPSRPVTAIVPFAGGSASDVVSRIMFDKMSKLMGQAIIVENRPGAGGTATRSWAADPARSRPM